MYFLALILQALVKDNSVLTLIYHLHDLVDLNILFSHIISNWILNPFSFVSKATGIPPTHFVLVALFCLFVVLLCLLLYSVLR